MPEAKRPLVITGQPPLPANSGYTYVIDTTSRGIVPLVASAARKVPGPYRHQWAGGRVRATVKNGSQAASNMAIAVAGTCRVRVHNPSAAHRASPADMSTSR